MFDAEDIARQALQRADETKEKRKNARRRTAAVLSVCAVSLGVFFFAFSTGILPRVDEYAGIEVEEPQVPLAAFPTEERQGIRPGDTELTLINEDSADQYSVMTVGDDETYTLYMIDLATNDVYTLETMPDGRYLIMLGNTEIGTLTITAGAHDITLW